MAINSIMLRASEWNIKRRIWNDDDDDERHIYVNVWTTDVEMMFRRGAQITHCIMMTKYRIYSCVKQFPLSVWKIKRFTHV